MNLARKLKHAVERDGIAGTAHVLGVRLVCAVAPFSIYRGVYIERADPEFLQTPAGYTPGFLTEDALRGFAREPENEISPAFLQAALDRGEQCYALVHGSELAAYGWYSPVPTPLTADGLVVYASSDYMYMHKGFTHPRHRGKRLHAIAMAQALEQYRQRGFRGLVSDVLSTNFPSLKSCYRLGYTVFGSAYLIKLGERYRIFCSPGCERFQFRVEQRRPSPAAQDRIDPKPLPPKETFPA